MQDHHPPHIYLSDTWYFITAATYNHTGYLNNDNHKSLIRDTLKSYIQKFNYRLKAWVILDNHYHVLMKIKSGNDLHHFFSQFHGFTSFRLNQKDRKRGRQVWHNYWDTCIRTDIDFWTRFNYIHNNPVKHGYVNKFEDWPFTSYHFYLKKKGKEWLENCFRDYPVFNFLDNDRFD